MHLLLLLTACHSTTDTTETDQTTTDDPTVHTGLDDPEKTGWYGSVVLGQWPADAIYGYESSYGYAVWTDQDGGIVDLAGCLFGQDVCTSDLGQPGDTLAVASTDFLAEAEFHDLTDVMAVGGTNFGVGFQYGLPVYTGTPTTWPGTTDATWNGDLAAFSGTDLFTWADSIVVTSPDPSVRTPLGATDTLDLAWQTGGAGDVYLRIGEEQRHLADDGAESLTPAELGLEAPVDSAVVILSRKTFGTFDGSGNPVSVETTSDQWLYVDYRDTAGWTELSFANGGVAEDCSAALSGTALAPGRYFGDSSTARDDHDLGYGNPLTNWDTPGRDVAFVVHLTQGQQLSMTYEQTVWDASFYVLDDTCSVVNALAGADDTLDSEPEAMDFTAPADGDYVVVLDAYYEGTTWWLEAAIR